MSHLPDQEAMDRGNGPGGRHCLQLMRPGAKPPRRAARWPRALGLREARPRPRYGWEGLAYAEIEWGRRETDSTPARPPTHRQRQEAREAHESPGGRRVGRSASSIWTPSKNIDGVEVTSIVGGRPATGKVVPKNAASSTGRDPNESLARPDVDAVILSTPTQMHAAQGHRRA